MANIYQNAKISLTSSGDTVLYTAPSNSRAIVKSILIAEDNNSTAVAEVTLTNTETGQEYMSDAEALADVQNPNTDTKSEHIRRDVNVTVEEIKIGAGFNISD